jgi:DNA (cytosine-5)-methyltransferase 1
MLRVIQEAKPAWIIGENVAGIVNMELDQVHIDLEAEDYEVESIIIPACGVDAPHRRNRVWIIGRNKNNNVANSEGLRLGGWSESSNQYGGGDGTERIKREKGGESS